VTIGAILPIKVDRSAVADFCSRRDGAIHVARSPEPFRDWY
jgi:hypothetical protein